MITNNIEEYNNRMKSYDLKLKKNKLKSKDVYINGEKTNYQICNNGYLLNTKNYHLVCANNINKKGEIKNNYKRVSIMHNNKEYKFQLHRLVAEYFCEIPDRLKEYSMDELQVNHINGIKTCNAAFNLEWCTPKENTNHSYDTGLANTSIGENSHLSKISNKDVIKISKMIMKGKSSKEIAEKMGVSKRTVQHIKYNECWKRTTQNFDFDSVKTNSSKPYSHDDKDIREVCKLLELHKYSDSEISRMTGMDRRYITEIRNGEKRLDISSLYKIDRSVVERVNSDNIEKVCKLLEEGKMSQRKIANESGVSQCLVSEIYNKKKFNELSSKYNFNK